jgi:hypothetical protein
LNFVIDRDAVNYRQNWLASALFTVFTQVLNAIYSYTSNWRKNHKTGKI